MRILLDECVPVKLCKHLSLHDCTTVTKAAEKLTARLSGTGSTEPNTPPDYIIVQLPEMWAGMDRA